MRRGLALLLAAAVLGCLLAPAAGAATDEIRPCGTSQGWEVNAGNFPPRIPRTKCAFARATDRAVKEFELARGGLPKQFGITVNGQALNCASKSSAGYAEVRCKNPRRFVLIYEFR